MATNKPAFSTAKQVVNVSVHAVGARLALQRHIQREQRLAQKELVDFQVTDVLQEHRFNDKQTNHQKEYKQQAANKSVGVHLFGHAALVETNFIWQNISCSFPFRLRYVALFASYSCAFSLVFLDLCFRCSFFMPLTFHSDRRMRVALVLIDV